jgi:His/Glu/Gln/Arg/opine family amino acid ABC transporter permease subunit
MQAFIGFSWQLLQGTWLTLQLAICALIIGLALGLLLALMQGSSFRSLRYVGNTFIFLLRGLPELLVLFFIYFGSTIILSKLFQHYVDVSPFTAGVAALSLIFAAYASQVFRGAFNAVGREQQEAAQALGLKPFTILWRIQLPQAWRHALPGLGNLWLVLLKDTAIVMLIGLTDLMGQAKIAANTLHLPFTFYLLAAFIYLIITSFSQRIIQFFTRRANRYLPV